MTQTVDSYRFLSGLTKRLVKSWIKMEEPRAIPWIPLPKPLSDCTVAMISTGGLALKTDEPFDQEGERQNPWWGDPSFRCIPRTSKEKDVRVYHLHVDPRPVEEDLNCLFPLERLLELEERGEIGRSASCHYSIMGYILQPETLLEESTPAMIGLLQDEEVDAVVLAPA
jgi:D-proline reductase (dithiol) PrdB